MNTTEKALVRVMLENKLLKAKGQQFEDLFTAIMGRARADFRPIKPQGKIGDRKNDGCEPLVGRYFQVYAPEDASEKESEAIKKIHTDFAGLKSYWGTVYTTGITEFYFVLNDRYAGAYPTTASALATLGTTNKLKVSDVFLCKDIERVVFSELQDDQIQSIVGFLPDVTTIVNVDYSMMTKAIAHILQHIPDQNVPGKLVSPTFAEKIAFNNLKYAAAYLQAASYQAAAVESFFERNVDFAKQDIRERLNDMYIEASAQPFTDDPTMHITREDQIFFSIVARATPVIPNNVPPASMQKAVLVLLAYFFEACDIFEEPVKKSNVAA